MFSYYQGLQKDMVNNQQPAFRVCNLLRLKYGTIMYCFNNIQYSHQLGGDNYFVSIMHKIIQADMTLY